MMRSVDISLIYEGIIPVLFFMLTCYTFTGCSPIKSFFQKDVENIPHDDLDEALLDNSLGTVYSTTSYMPDDNGPQRKSPNGPHTSVPTTMDKFIPDYYKVVFTLKTDEKVSNERVILKLCEAIAKILNLPVESVKVVQYETTREITRIYFICTVKSGDTSDVLIPLPASEVAKQLSADVIQKSLCRAKIISIRSAEDSILEHPLAMKRKAWSTLSNNDHWEPWQLAIIIASCLFAAFCICVVIYGCRSMYCQCSTFLRRKWRSGFDKHQLFLSTRNAKKENPPTVGEPRHVILQPVLKPVVADVDIIQPENRDSYITETDSEHTPSPCRSPLRIKSKGLLERRGSNASLTLDLNHSQENVNCATPPKECSTEEYLLSAGNRMTRKQLRNCLKDVKALHAEFWEIPMNHPEKVEIPGSGTKNRYKTILPNESTRVQLRCLDEDPLSSYINANYIRGYDGEYNAYIATQGPMAHTVDDFWMMVWGEKSPIIVMITKLKEKLKVKCEPYVPDHKATYEDIEVTVLKVIPRDGYTVRELFLRKGKETHCVYHFWYTAWPDHKTPETAKQLLSMALEVEALRHDPNGATKGPTIVHCSAGIGRTGCFIATSIGIQQLLEENMVDILGTVCSLRLDRGGMVQTAEQYEFVHQALSVFEQTIPDQSGE